MTPCIQLEHLSKRFGGVSALDDVSFDITRGEVHAVVGENGAGKSTLMKILAGVHSPDAGQIRIEGRPVRLGNPREAARQGISIVFQELNLFPHRSVAANIFVNREAANRAGLVRRQYMREATQRVLSELGVTLSPDALIAQLTIAERQLVEIARTLQQESRIIILDEPNSALNESESRRLFEIVRGLRERGITIIYVSHRLEEVFAIADRITVIRDGRYQGTHETADTSIPEIIAAMIGRSFNEPFPEKDSSVAPGSVTLEIRDLCRNGEFGPISFTARAGEILGFAGLEGSGLDELFHTLFGLSRPDGGEILVGGAPANSKSARAAMHKGFALIPESRREQGLMMDWSVARNATLLILDQLRRIGLLDKSAIRRTTTHYIERLAIDTDRQDKKVLNLSGGNQQKVLLAKWLATKPGILILNDPTRGVDVGAKREIYVLCHQLAAEGMTILLTSSELEEILGLADRVLVLRKGTVVREFSSRKTTKGELMHALAGG
jgi:rhamnose transport system ATP-binding protein